MRFYYFAVSGSTAILLPNFKKSMIEKKATEGNPSVAFFFPFYIPSTQKGELRSMVFVKKGLTL
jgi:hypothetical protein